MNAPLPSATGFVRSSRYIEMRDGVRLAIDILRPTVAGLVHDDPRPVIWVATKYQRARVAADGRIEPITERIPVLRDLLLAGYVVAVLDIRGSGASFGVYHGVVSPADPLIRWDLHEVCKWLGEQPWSSGAVGMYGVSFVAGTQIAAALTQPPYLRCIVPQQVVSDPYRGFMNINGIQNIRYRHRRDGIMRRLNIEQPAAPVDEDLDGSMLAAAVEQHRAQRASLPDLLAVQFADDWCHVRGDSHGLNNALSEWPLIASSGIAIFHWGSWRDLYPDESAKLYATFRDSNPSRLIMGPWTHEAQERQETRGLDVSATLRQWYDFWLKGEDNGYSQAPRVRYVVLRAPPEDEWRSAEDWPLPETRQIELFLQGDGQLGPAPGAGATDYTVDFSVTTAPLATRYSSDRGDADFSSFDARGATFTTEAFPEDAELVGHPLMHLWISSSADDVDVFAYLQVVESDGTSRTLTEGMIRASCRAEGTAPRPNLGLPYHPCFRHAARPLEHDRPNRLAFELLPTAVLIRAGERLRLTVVCADREVWDTPVQDPPPRVRLHHDAGAPSRLVTPFLRKVPALPRARHTGSATDREATG